MTPGSRGDTSAALILRDASTVAESPQGMGKRSRELYRRRRPPLRRALPPRRGSSGTMSIVRPLIWVPRKDSIAASASASSAISTYAKPLGRPRRPLTILAETTVPNWENAVLRSASVVSCARLPTYSVPNRHPPSTPWPCGVTSRDAPSSSIPSSCWPLAAAPEPASRWRSPSAADGPDPALSPATSSGQWHSLA